MSNDYLEYNGRSSFRRPRSLTESEGRETDFFKEDTILKQEDSKQEIVDKIFADLAISFIKGNKLKQALRDMEPAQFIEIEPSADMVSTSAARLNPSESKNGTIITYSMYTNAIDKLLDLQWSFRLKYLNMQVPASVQAQTTSIHETKTKGAGESLISEFLAQNGIAGTIIGMLTMAPFQSIIFQTLTVEKGAQTVQAAQIPIGIALLLELGVKAEAIIKLLNTAKISVPQVEKQVNTLAKDPFARSEALKAAGIDPKDLTKATETSDCENITNYVSEFYKRYGGLAAKDSHLSIDHWIAYGHVARNQQTIRGALNTAETFSPSFRTIRNETTPTKPLNDFEQKINSTSEISVELVSVTRSLRERSNDLYDDILDSFQYQITDKDMCCLVQIFGSFEHTGWMKTIASILRILAVNLSGHFIQIDNMLRNMIGNYLQDSLFELIAQINELHYKVLRKITKAFTIELGDNISSCTGMLTLGWAISHSVNVLFAELDGLLADLSSVIGNYGQKEYGSWTAAADRRHLLGLARILEVLAFSIDRASNCNNKKSSDPQNFDPSDDYDAILSIVGKMPPTLNLSETDIQKYFPNRKSRTSEILKYQFGINTEQNNTDETISKNARNCHDPAYKAQIEKLIQNLNLAFKFSE